MSYCRFSDGDVYMYEHVGGFIECCACCLAEKVDTIFTKGIKPDHPFYNGPDDESSKPCRKCGGVGCEHCQMFGNKIFNSRKEALKHLQEHRDAGHDVPQYAFDRLIADSEQEGDEIAPYKKDSEEALANTIKLTNGKDEEKK